MNRRIIVLAGVVFLAAACIWVAPASAQVQASVLTAEAECAPDGSTQGVVFTFVNHQGLSVDIDFADAEGTAFADEDVHDLTFAPTTVADGGSATASLSFPGTASGTIETELAFTDTQDNGDELNETFTIAACAVTATTPSTTPPTTAPPAVPAPADPAFTG